MGARGTTWTWAHDFHLTCEHPDDMSNLKWDRGFRTGAFEREFGGRWRCKTCRNQTTKDYRVRRILQELEKNVAQRGIDEVFKHV